MLQNAGIIQYKSRYMGIFTFKEFIEFYIYTVYIQYTINTIGTSGYIYLVTHCLNSLGLIVNVNILIIICWGPSALSAPHASDII
jgi:hypothetical protein